ncbi:amino acid transporter [Nostocoides sp. F2B08]|uniref:LysE/ArgO family amino acid transporter n=1 Tax=Nostocoides sp. F2B08 TaxID=2653936 RepID=UPI001262E499|nr:LysE/ArgO family amino acid transporter [Tetrasphaera sp. F2B08]KAB7744171.1 amino acid transporter [Tetrasphaera sp. F2B08]
MTSAQLLTSALAGLGLGLGLIVAIGAQNAFVLRQGIRGEHVLPVVLICIISDAVLIVAGVAGAGALFTAMPWLATAATWGGAAFLISYAVLAARRAVRRPEGAGAGASLDLDSCPEPAMGGYSAPAADDLPGSTATRVDGTGSTLVRERPAATAGAGSAGRRAAVLGTVLALTWLNPHVYLDAVVLLGSVAATHGEGRWAFAAGAVLGSTVWFSALGVASRALAPVFARPAAWRVLDGVIAVVMTAIAVALVLTH